MNYCLILGCLLFSLHVNAAHDLDVYGVSAEESQKILQRYGKRIANIFEEIHQGKTQDPSGFFESKQAEQLHKKLAKTLDEIKQQEHYAYAWPEAVYYAGNDYCVTLDVVTDKQKDRLHFIKNKLHPRKNYPKKHDIIDKMDEYSLIGMELFLADELKKTSEDCPVYHCSMGFHHPKLKPYLEIFNEAAQQQKTLILNTMNTDPDPERRAAAVFYVGHFKNPHEIISILLPHLNDPDEEVRNNVIRVIAMTSAKAEIIDIDPKPFLTLLDSPSLTDRNKSLFVLSATAKSKLVKQYLIQHGQESLLAILAMKQPDHHDIAYNILKEISGQDFGNNIEAWRSWFKKSKKSVV